MDAFIERFWWVVDLAVIGGIAFITTSTVNAYVEGSLRRVPGAPPLVLPSDELPPPAPRKPEPVAPKIYPGPPVREPPRAPEPSTLSATLVGTVVSDDPRWSHFVLVDEATRTTAVYGKGSIVGDGLAVAKIERRRVTFRRGDRLEYLDLDGDRPGGQRVAAHVGDAGAKGITKTSPTSYVVPYSEIEMTLSNLNDVAGQARFFPNFQGGHVDGFKVTSIKAGGIFSRIGMQNGDVLQKVNGLEINSPEKALEVFQRLKDERHLVVRINRNGTPVEMQYTIR